MLKEFFYIDRDLLLMYFAQLPPEDRLTFRREYRTDLELELSLTPKIGTKRQRPDLPDSIPVALASFLGPWLEAHETIGDTVLINEHFIAREFEIGYTRLPRGILVAFPREGGRNRMRKFGGSFVILGDSANCNHQWNRPISGRSDASTMERLYAVWEDICFNRGKDTRGERGKPFRFRGGADGGREDVFQSLMDIECMVRRRCIPARLRGICRVRTRIKGRIPGQTLDHEGELSVLYPLFLERLNDEPGE